VSKRGRVLLEADDSRVLASCESNAIALSEHSTEGTAANAKSAIAASREVALACKLAARRSAGESRCSGLEAQVKKIVVLMTMLLNSTT
jgi:hypothetical protein